MLARTVKNESHHTKKNIALHILNEHAMTALNSFRFLNSTEHFCIKLQKYYGSHLFQSDIMVDANLN